MFRRMAMAAAVVTALTVVVVPTAAAAPDSEVSTNIVGGVDATETYPWAASLQGGGGSHYCTGTLVGRQWVVTANHCLNNAGHASVRVGSTNSGSGGELVKVAGVAVGPDDVGLVQLARPVSARPAKIPTAPTAVGAPIRILGWGVTCDPGCRPPTGLKELDTTLFADSRCQGIKAATELCVGNVGGSKGACYGDSGGPAVEKVAGEWVVVGATSRAGGGGRCGTIPAVYGDLVAHRAWIMQWAGSN